MGVVQVYKNHDYDSQKADLDVGSISGQYIKDDWQISSLKIADGYKCTVYTGLNYTGTSRVFTGWAPRVGKFDNNISSLKVEKIDPPGSIIVPVRVYRDNSYKNEWADFNVGSYDKSDLQNCYNDSTRETWNLHDQIDSIMVTSGYECTVYEHENYNKNKSGKSKTITGNISKLDDYSLGDCISSLKVEKIVPTGVSITGVPSAPMLPGSTVTLRASVTPSDALDTSVKWSSNNTPIATVSTSGVVTAHAAGTAVITVTTNSGSKTATCTVIVNPIAVTKVTIPATLSLVAGNSGSLTLTIEPANATNKSVIWSSSNEPVATVSSSGVVTAKAAGTATITVTSAADSSKKATCTVTVTAATVAVTGVTLNKTTLSLEAGKNETLTATIAPTNATNKNVTWTTDKATVATVNASGLVSAIAVGTAKITVTTADGNKTTTCTVTVTAAIVTVTGVTLNKTTLSLEAGKSETLTATVNPANATNKSVTWESNNATVATVDNSGKVTAKTEGTATITVKTSDGNKTAPCTVTVTPAPSIKLNKNLTSIIEGNTETLTATTIPANATVTWTTSNQNVATVDAAGKVKAIKTGKGDAKITASITVNGVTLKAECTVKVKGAEITLAQMMNSGEGKQDLQQNLYLKLKNVENINPNFDFENKGYDLLKKMVQDKKLKPSERLFRKELETAKEYFADTTSKTWSSAHKLEEFDWFSVHVDKLLDLFSYQQKIGSSLIPIKGISKIMQAKLREYPINNVADLLSKGRTQGQRDNIAKFLDVDIRLVNTWVKQADLWRVVGMTTDMAYLLVQIGVRHADDLAKIDCDKAYPIMERLVLAQPDFYLAEKSALLALIANAKSYAVHSCVNEQKASKALLAEIDKKIKEGKSLTENEIKTILEKNKSESVISSNIETWEPAPLYLFEDDFLPLVLKTSGQIIRQGLEFLNNVPMVLPLPCSISGQIFWRKMGVADDEKIPYGNVLVEVGGISTSSGDKTEKEKIPSAYADSLGKFRIVLPEKLNLQEGITITVTQESWKQKFMISASEIINAVPEQRTLELFRELQEIQFLITYEEKKPMRLAALKADLNTVKIEREIIENKIKEDGYTSVLKSKLSDLIEEESRISREIKELDDQRQNFDKEIKRLETKFIEVRNKITGDSRKIYNDLEIIFENLVSSDNKYEAKLGKTGDNPKGEDFILIDEIFKGYDFTLRKALPSVKLMGNDDEAVHLPTDTAPSRVFNYNMLQRLVEPALGPGGAARRILDKPVDVMTFKAQLYTNPDNYPQMSSLGIGYVLNMHQAWVPDGFALGTLLYSLVLAPGEEQRLVVRESLQSYTVADDAEGTDSDLQSYELSQMDDATAAYNYALNQLTKGSSNYDYTAKTSAFGGGYGGAVGVSAGMVNMGSSHGIAGSTSKASGSGSAGASQSNAHNEASNAAQTFQHSIKSAANRVSQSKRISMRTASSEESNSVATKIIANHNHSHTMTIQYWEVMRRFRLETCINGIELVLFVPLRLIRFIPDGVFTPNLTNFNRDMFIKRYDVLMKYADQLLFALPFKYRLGLNLIKKYAAYPDWRMENLNMGTRAIVITFDCDLLSFDDLTASLTLKNRKGTVAGIVDYTRGELSSYYKTRKELKQAIRDIRNRKINKKQSVTCTFMVPDGFTDDDLSHITLNYSCEGLEYTLYQNYDSLEEYQKKAYDKMQDKIWDMAKDNKGTAGDRRDIAHYESQLPEAFRSPNVILSSRDVVSLGAPTISNPNINSKDLGIMLSSSSLTSSVVITLSNSTPVMRYAELQQIESTMHHIASDTLHYSQVIWSSLSNDELAMMLEQYTIDMDFGKFTGVVDKEENEEEIARGAIHIPLLNCVNVKKVLGFYGNCVLMPFTYPKELARQLGKSAAEVQDALYRYHAHCFRVPTTTISLPTDGMVGEAVLGETNVSEVIDLTRFWNWKDSPIDKMEITSDYLNNKDYLEGKEAPQITALNLPGATAPVPVTVPDLIKALVDKQTPQFENITGLDQLKDILNEGTKSAAAGRKEVLDTTVELAKQAVEVLKATAGKTPNSQNSSKDKNPSGNTTPPGGNNSTPPGGNTSTPPGGNNSTTPDGNNSTTPGGNNSTTPDGSTSTTPGGNTTTTPGGGNTTDSTLSDREQHRAEWQPTFDKIDVLLNIIDRNSLFDKEKGILVIPKQCYTQIDDETVNIHDSIINPQKISSENNKVWKQIVVEIDKLKNKLFEKGVSSIKDKKTDNLVFLRGGPNALPAYFWEGIEEKANS